METKYIVIYNDIVDKIDSRIYKANDKLPSESNLMDIYQVSRDTIRKSFALLEQNGYIQKTQGKRAFVLDRHQFNFPVSGIVSFKELSQSLGKENTTYVEKLRCYKSDADMAKKLEIQKNDRIWEVVRAREIEGERVILDKDYLVESIVPNLTESICQDSLYNYIENVLGLKIAYANKEITAQMATTEDYQYLDMKHFNMVIVVKSYTYLEDTSLFQYTESRHRPDKFVFVDFARR